MISWDSAERTAVEQALAERLEGQLQAGERVVVQGEADASQVLARFVLEGGPAGERVVAEAKVDLAEASLDAQAARDLALDALDLLLLEYLAAGRARELASGVFEERELGGKPLRVRLERTFPALEAEADAWLLGGKGEDA